MHEPAPEHGHAVVPEHVDGSDVVRDAEREHSRDTDPAHDPGRHCPRDEIVGPALGSEHG